MSLQTYPAPPNSALQRTADHKVLGRGRPASCAYARWRARVPNCRRAAAELGSYAALMTRLLAFLILCTPTSAYAQERLIGLLEIPSLHKAVNDGTPDAETAPLTLLAEPVSTSAQIAIAQTWRQLKYSEHDYEVVSAIVYDRQYASSGGLWYKLQFSDSGTARFGWVPHVEGMRYRDLHSLVRSKMSYLTLDWDRRLREAPSLEAPSMAPAVSGTPPSARIIEIYNPRGTNDIWYLVAIVTTPCTDERPEILATGWVPAYAQNGGNTMWFFSRGC